MQAFTDFLMNNYLWFLVISIVLVFALIGYFVDQSEQKKGVSIVNRPKEKEVDIKDLASRAQNKSINTAINESLKKSTVEMPAKATPTQNTITNVQTNETVAPNTMNTLTK